ncbi:glycoside hydrolase family 88 protein [Neobacillus sp. 179-C4.2 HS]|uniref:Glycoside hydrolase family 88 protein n=1 Tax=Neobacillus driksii TaxID=3035913 RepID=A0ABV4YPZ1_9BACI|nr:glycoside hydrolase family 88 protein [Neobacillus sp. 179.-C4.2 HS]MDP5195556.1 glycoside hydrolase family 88 protein [Neobacillus sp. 179.-C4.2 HS]
MVINSELVKSKLHLVTKAMKSLKSDDDFVEEFPIGLIDINLWEWPQGVGIYGLYKYYQLTKDKETFDFLLNWYNQRLQDGLPEKNVNTMSPMLTLMYLAEETNNPKYIEVCDEWSTWIMEEMLRTGDGALQHMITGDPNDGQILIDTLFMTVLFLAKAGNYFDRPEYIEESKKQFLIHIKYLFDKETGLFFHGWDFNENHNYGAVHWGRGNGWYTCGLLEYFEMVELEKGIKEYLLDTWFSQVKALAKFQAESGLWHTVLDDPSSYEETSATAAFGFGIIKGVRKGYLDQEYLQIGLKALEAQLKEIDENGIVQKVSYGTPVGNDAQFYKNIPISPMTYGQALAILLLIEAMEFSNSESKAINQEELVRSIFFRV